MSASSRIAFLHPDLGIGGAERLVIDAAMSLQAAGHRVTIFTSHHDPARCFPETRDGTLDVRVYGDFLPRHVGQRLRAPSAITRLAYTSLAMTLRHGPFDLIFCDLVPHTIPLLRCCSGAPVLYYCHFPDQLHVPSPRGLYRLYRQPLNWVEEVATGMAHRILVNSQFTAEVFRQTFPSLRAMPLEVLHPAIDPAIYETVPDTPDDADGPITILSINRYEPKKRHDLALSAFAQMRRALPAELFGRLRLVVVGGYDDRLAENRSTFQALMELARSLGILEQTEFIRSCTDDERLTLLSHCRCVVYTPIDEHFGYGPIEAMAASRPVVAANSGGPRETVRHGETGLLCEPTPEAFADALAHLVTNGEAAAQMGRAGRARVAQHFARAAFAGRLQAIVGELTAPSSL